MAYWSHLEIPCGCCVELPPVFTYLMHELCDPESPWWVVAYTELSAKKAAYILFEVYESCRLWKLSHEIIHGIRSPYLKTVLGNAVNM